MEKKEFSNDFRKGIIYHFLVLFLLIEGSIFNFGFIPRTAGKPLQCMELQEKEVQKDKKIQEICLERTYS